MKTVWIINQYAGSVYHGKEYRSPSIARQLSERGYNVTIISASHSHHFTKAPPVRKTFTMKKIGNVHYLWVKTGTYKKSKSLNRLINMFEFFIKVYFLPKNLLNNPDYIMVSSPSPLPILNGIRLKKKYNSKLLFEVRDLWPLSVVELGNMPHNHPFIRFLFYIEKIACRESDLVISVLEKSEKYLKNQGLSSEKFLFIPNGIDINLLENKKCDPYSIINKINTNKFIVGYAGALGIANNLYALLDAAKIIKDNKNIQIVLLGSGSEETKLKKYVDKFNLNNVAFLGSVHREEVHNVLRFFDVCYIGLQKSNLFSYGVSPAKLYDYMAAAKPILYAVDSGNHPVRDAKCGIEVNSGSVDDIVEAILTLYHMDEKEREKLGKNGYKTLIEHYTFDKLTDELIKRMEDLS